MKNAYGRSDVWSLQYNTDNYQNIFMRKLKTQIDKIHAHIIPQIQGFYHRT